MCMRRRKGNEETDKKKACVERMSGSPGAGLTHQSTIGHMSRRRAPKREGSERGSALTYASD